MTVIFEGKTITLKQEPTIDGTNESPLYKAYGVDQDGHEYIVTWDVVEGHEEIEDQSEMCDWDNPSGLMKV